MINTVYNTLWCYCSAIYVHKTWLYDLRTNQLPVTPLTVLLSPAPHQVQEVDCIHHTTLLGYTMYSFHPKVRNHGEGPSRGLLRDYEPSDAIRMELFEARV